MKIKFILYLFCISFFSVNLVVAEVPATVTSTQTSINPPQRARIDDLQKESSSFVADPDPLDPLPVKKESLKEEEEPVLEDIKTILNSPVKKKTKVTDIKPESSAPSVSDSSNEVATNQKAVVISDKKNNKKAKSQKNKKTKKTATKNNLKPDDPDLNYEKKLNQIYQTYNITPTSEELWGQVTSGRKVETFIVEKGNTLESISRMLFGDSQFWPKIWALNHEQISNPHQIYPGLKIYFFPGTDLVMPAVSMKSVVDQNISYSGKSLDGRDYSPQMTEFEKFNIKNQNKNKINGPQPLPDSLPIVRRKDYFIKKKQGETFIDLREMPIAKLTIPNNPYVLSPDLLKTDFAIPESEVENIICIKDQYIKKTIRKNPQAQPGRYLLVEHLSTVRSNLKKTNIYKIVGDVLLSEKNELRIKSCDQLINSDTLIVSESKVQALPEPTETMAHPAQLVESLEAENLDFFNFGQRVVINSGSNPMSAGQSLNIYSESAGGVVGKLQILKTTGTMAIGFLTGISRLIQIGDEVRVGDDLNNTSSTDSTRNESEPDLNIE